MHGNLWIIPVSQKRMKYNYLNDFITEKWYNIQFIFFLVNWLDTDCVGNCVGMGCTCTRTWTWDRWWAQRPSPRLLLSSKIQVWVSIRTWIFHDLMCSRNFHGIWLTCTLPLVSFRYGVKDSKTWDKKSAAEWRQLPKYFT